MSIPTREASHGPCCFDEAARAGNVARHALITATGEELERRVGSFPFSMAALGSPSAATPASAMASALRIGALQIAVTMFPQCPKGQWS
jgi:hypothetical protein